MPTKINWFLVLVVTGSTLARPGAAESWSLIQEAERANAVVSPAHVVPNPQARQGQCVMLSEGGASVRSNLRDLSANAGSKNGELDFDVDLPQAGRYRIWVRAQWHCVCSNSFYLLTTGTPQLPENTTPSVDDNQSEPYRVKASVPPRTWRWLLAATCDFTAGKQKLRLIQAGHEALIDAVMLTSDSAERPPGFEDQSRTCLFSLGETGGEKKRPGEVAWVRSGADAACQLGSTDWADFHLEFLVPPDTREPELDATWGAAFARQPNGSDYSILFSRSGKGSTSVQLRAFENGQRRTIASQDCGALAPGEPHWVRIVRLADSITVAVDGVARLAATDSALASGSITLLAENSEGFQFQGLQVSPLKNYLEHFQAGTGDWRVHAGTWRAVKAGGSDEDEMACMANAADEGGLIVPAWTLGEAYVLSTQVQLAGEGAAGFAFDVQDAKHYRAALLHWREGGTVELQFHRIADGKREVLQSHAATTDPRQWHALRLTRQSEFAEVQLDGVDFGKCWTSSANESAGVGLALAPGSSCLFGQVNGRTYTSPSNGEFLVEGIEAPITLCQWKPVNGIARVQVHPAAIFLSSERAGETARLELNRETKGDVRLEATFYKYGSAAAKSADPLTALPELMLPPLPDAPRVAIVFHRDEGGQPVEYALLTDWETMREVTLQRNGNVLDRTHTAKQSHPEGYKIYLHLKENTLTGGVAGVSEVHATVPEPEPHSGRTKISITTQNFAPHDEAGLVEMRLCN